MPEQAPTIGRIVHYWPVDFDLLRKKGQPYPAMITHVWNDDCVNLAIAGDKSFPLDEEGHRTSVMRARREADDGDLAGCWDWPVRSS